MNEKIVFVLALGALLLGAGTPSALTAQNAERGLSVTLPSDSAELAYLTDLIQTALQPPVEVGPIAGEFVSGRIYPFGASRRYVVIGVLSNPVSGDAYWVLHPFGVGVGDASSRVLAPTSDVVEVIGIGDVFGTGRFAVVFCSGPQDAAKSPTMLVFEGDWAERDLTGSTVWRCAAPAPESH